MYACGRELGGQQDAVFGRRFVSGRFVTCICSEIPVSTSVCFLNIEVFSRDAEMIRRLRALPT